MAWNSLGIPQIPNMPRPISSALIQFGGSQLINRIFGDYWGIFDQRGIPLLLVDNVVSVKYENKSQVARIPVENGAFASYNKVADPYSVSVLLTKSSGGVMKRGAFLAMLEAFAQSIDLFMVITPEAIYPNCAIVGYDYARQANDGARMIKAMVHLQEVRLVEVKYSKTESPNTKSDQAQGMQDKGRVQAQEVPEKQSMLSKMSGWFK